jgi:hypothetical protein
MSFTSDTRQQISLKKLSGKAHTKNQAEVFNEPKTTGITISAQTVFGEVIPANPLNENLYDVTDDIVEYVRLPLSFAPEAVQPGPLYHGYFSSLPANYSSSSTSDKSGEGNFISNKAIHSSAGDVQIVPPSFGVVYEVKAYIGGDATTKGSGELITVTDERYWYFDYFNGVFFQQNPGEGTNSADPDYIEAFIYIGKKSNETSNSSLSSLWEPDPANSDNLRATKILDGDTGLFSLDFNMTLDNDNIINTIKYVTTKRNDARDLYFEFDDNGNITTKE